jgi:hypothetical protein
MRPLAPASSGDSYAPSSSFSECNESRSEFGLATTSFWFCTAVRICLQERHDWSFVGSHMAGNLYSEFQPRLVGMVDYQRLAVWLSTVHCRNHTFRDTVIGERPSPHDYAQHVQVRCSTKPGILVLSPQFVPHWHMQISACAQPMLCDPLASLHMDCGSKDPRSASTQDLWTL